MKYKIHKKIDPLSLYGAKSNMTPEELYKELLNEYKIRSEKERIKFFVPQPQQQPVTEDNHKIVAVSGGNRSGKTHIGAYIIAKEAVENDNIVIWVISVSYDVQREVTQKKLLYFLPDYEIDKMTFKTRGIIDKIKLKNKTEIVFKTHEQTVESFSGASVNHIWFDEEPPKDIYAEAYMRTLDNRGRILFTLTPVNGMTWIYDDIFSKAYKDKDISIYNFLTENNTTISRDEIEKMKEKYSEDEIEIRLHGAFVSKAGLVYKQFKEEVHVIPQIPIEEINNKQKYVIWSAMDFGYTNPTAVLWAAVDRGGNVIVFNEYYRSERTIDQLKEDISALHNQYTNKGVLYCDPSLWRVNPVDGHKLSTYFKQSPNSLPIVKANNNVDLGINIVRDYLLYNEHREPKLHITENCENLIYEMRHYENKQVKNLTKNASEEPKKFRDHAVDALRYLLVKRPYFYTPKVEELHELVYSRAGY